MPGGPASPNGVGTAVAPVWPERSRSRGETVVMRKVVNTFAELSAIVMILVALAMSTAALAQ